MFQNQKFGNFHLLIQSILSNTTTVELAKSKITATDERRLDSKISERIPQYNAMSREGLKPQM